MLSGEANSDQPKPECRFSPSSLWRFKLLGVLRMRSGLDRVGFGFGVFVFHDFWRHRFRDCMQMFSGEVQR